MCLGVRGPGIAELRQRRVSCSVVKPNNLILYLIYLIFLSNFSTQVE